MEVYGNHQASMIVGMDESTATIAKNTVYHSTSQAHLFSRCSQLLIAEHGVGLNDSKPDLFPAPLEIFTQRFMNVISIGCYSCKNDGEALSEISKIGEG